MSARLDEILAVLAIIASSGGASFSLPEIRRRRLFAIKEVAKQLGITHETVRDACTRQLRPHVEGVDKFDKLLLDWLASGSTALETAVRHHTVDYQDVRRLDEFFSTHGPRSHNARRAAT